MAYIKEDTTFSNMRRRKRGNGRSPGQTVNTAEDDDRGCFLLDSNEEERQHQELPLLRRSSTVWSSSTNLSRRSSDGSLSWASLVDDGDNGVVLLHETGHATLQEPSRLRLLSSTVTDNAIRTMQHQLQGMTEDFSKSGLPWSGKQCQSFAAGGTGILYCLPAIAVAFAATSSCAGREGYNGFEALSTSVHHLRYVEQAAWILQAYLSVMADYVHIHHDSIFHGLDRFYATFNTVATLLRAMLVLPAMTMLALGSPPILCFVLANRAKTMATSYGDEQTYYHLRKWHLYHGAWHVTGSVAVAVAVYWMHGDSGDIC